MRNIKIAAAQFEPRNGDKNYNLSIIEELTEKAKNKEANIISFHELSVTAYTFLKNITKSEIINLAEQIPNGESTKKLIKISKKYDIPILAGLVENNNGNIFNSYIVVDSSGVLAIHQKLHPFINPIIKEGNEYTIFDLCGWKCGILICYDNNVIENVRATVLSGADIIFAPHVTMCTPSSMPGRGFVDDNLWQKRINDPESLRLEFDGPKGREWLMRWLPARAYDNGVYYVFTNPIGYDGDQLKNGNSMILDPYGEVLSEVRSFNDDLCIAEINADKIKLSGGYRYRKARRPELFKAIIGHDNVSSTKPYWLKK